MPYYPRRTYAKTTSSRGYARISGAGAYKVKRRVVAKRRVAVKPMISAAPAAVEAPSEGRQLARRVGGTIADHVYDVASAGASLLKNKIMSIMGSGDYVTGGVPRQNCLMSDAQIPKFRSSSEAVTISHREYIGDVISSSTAGAFNLQSFLLNPGSAKSFPWLSQIAPAFQQYRWNGIVYEFRSMSADALNSVNTALGTVTIATDYDSVDGVFKTKQQMENTEFAVSCKPSRNMMHGIECARNQTVSNGELYVRNGDSTNTTYAAGTLSTGSQDSRWYDLGITSIATQGCQGTSVNLGELWVSYSVTLFKTIQMPRLSTALCAVYKLSTAAVAASTPVELNGSTVVFDNIGLVRVSGGFSFPLGTPAGTSFRINYLVQGALVTGGITLAVPVLTGCVSLPAFNSATVAATSACGGTGTEGQFFIELCVAILPGLTSPATITFPSANTWFAPTVSADLQIDELNTTVWHQ